MSPALSKNRIGSRRNGGVIPALRSLISEYRKRRSEIRQRLKEFSALHKGRNEDIFKELSFCLLTANANALKCEQAIKELIEDDLLLKGKAHQLRPKLKGRVRFHNKKADFIVGARAVFSAVGRGNRQKIDIKRHLDFNDPFAARQWLVENIKGFGYKEASHFLRNIGLGRDIAILDRHILKNLKNYGVIDKIPSSLGKRSTYLDIEDRMRAFSEKIDIPLEELDLLFWSLETGFVFK